MATVEISYNGTDITADVVIAEAVFASQVNGRPGTCKFKVKDPNRDKSFTVGKPIALDIDGDRVWVGFLSRVSRAYAFEAHSPQTRLLLLEGVDINILFRKRFVFNQTTPTNVSGVTYADVTSTVTAVNDLTSDWLDLSGDGIDVSTLVEDIGNINVDQAANVFFGSESWEGAMRSIVRLPGGVFYIDPQKRLVVTDVDTASATYPLTDQPTESYPDVIDADDPLAWYRLGEPSGAIIDETGGTSGSVLGGTVTRDVAGAIADDDGAIDEVTGFISVPDQAKLDLGNGAMTIEAWIRPDSVSGNRSIVSKGSGAYYFRLSSGKLQFLRSQQANLAITTTATVSTGVWSHVVVTYAGGNGAIKFYINGVSQTVTNQGTPNLGDNNNALTFGRETFNTEAFDGRMDEVALYNRALTADEVATHYRAGVNGRTVGYREMEILHSATDMVNDALIWGVGGGSAQPVFRRLIDQTSVTSHGRWQLGQTYAGVWRSGTVNKIADSIVNGSSQSKRGHKNDAISVTVTTFEPGYLPAQKVEFTSNVFNFSDTLPIRRMEIIFPTGQPKYRLYLSHELDQPFELIDPYRPPYISLPPLGGLPPIGPIDSLPDIPEFPGEGACTEYDDFTDRVSTYDLYGDDSGTWAGGRFPWNELSSAPFFGLGVGVMSNSGIVESDPDFGQWPTGSFLATTVSRADGGANSIGEGELVFEGQFRTSVVPDGSTTSATHFNRAVVHQFFLSRGDISFTQYFGCVVSSSASFGFVYTASSGAAPAAPSSDGQRNERFSKTDWVANTWYRLKFRYDPVTGTAECKVWPDGTAEPGYQVSVTHADLVAPVDDPQATISYEYGDYRRDSLGTLSNAVTMWDWFSLCGDPPDGATPVYNTSDTCEEFTGNSVQTLFEITGAAYLPYTLRVWVNGLLQRRGIDYFETDHDAGTFTFATAPATGDVIRACYRATTESGSAGGRPPLLL